MNITFIAFGTRGDVQPAIALGRELKAKGHHVRILAGSNYKSWIESHGLESAAATIDIQEVMESEGGSDWVEQGYDQIKQMNIMRQLLQHSAITMMNDAWQAAQDAQAIFSSFTSTLYAVSIAEKLNLKHIAMPLQPSLIATRDGRASVMAPLPNRVHILNYLVGKVIIERGPWMLMGDHANAFRQKTLGLPPITLDQYLAAHRERMIVVQGYSQHVVPHPADWSPNMHTTGYWFLDEDENWQPPDELANFLESGSPPVCIGFGSMTGRSPEKLTRLIVEAVRQSGQRAILLSGWSGMGDVGLPDSILRLDSTPHRWLYPRVAAAVHHGGAGTTAASLRAGVPTVIIPHMSDQPFWGTRIEALGVGPKAIPRPKLTASALAHAIHQAVTDDAMKKRAAELGAKIRSENGIANAIAIIERYLTH
jgi:UDP:flavonoid glycosyltransferase YjiC (YdhE family)